MLATLVTFTGSLSHALVRTKPQPTVPAPAKATTATAEKKPAAAPATKSATPAAKAETHTVKAGETLFAIARLYGASVDGIKQANGLTGDKFTTGQVLKVPGAQPVRHYTVQQGDSLWELADRYGLPLEDLLASNPQIGNPGHLQIGQEIILPGSGAVAAQQAVAAAAFPSLRGVFAWPVLARISSPFGPRDGRNHNGIDLAAQMGDPIKAARDGEVILSGPVSGYGETVILRHEDGSRTLYAHASRRLVQAGERVRQGEVIAEVGSTGHSTGPHLHFEIIVNNKPYDPMLYLPKS
ncbi:MAG TPA: M23 family metallopeptidase [Candidatus Sulfotelmatobacter sp.]|nr:M23 family metallopeptidase [Candidatus Sulfotelmatobacter sp.]